MGSEVNASCWEFSMPTVMILLTVGDKILTSLSTGN